MSTMTTTTKFLVLRFAGTRLFFGKTRIDFHIKTNRIPPKSQIVGLLANALGYDRQDIELQTNLQNRIEYAVRIDKEGVIETDYQTVDGKLLYKHARMEGSENFEIRQKFNTDLSCGIYMVAIELSAAKKPSDVSLEDLWKAIENPARALFIGHKDCIPSMRIGLGIFEAESLEQLMAKIPRLRFWGETLPTTEKKLECWLPIQDPSEFENLNALDLIEEFNDEYDHKNKIHGGQRWMKRKFIGQHSDQLSLGGRNFENSRAKTNKNNTGIVLTENTNFFSKSDLDFPKNTRKQKEQVTMHTRETFEQEQPIEKVYEITLLADTKIMKKLAIKHRPDNRPLLEQEITKDYISHVLISCLFGSKAPSSFSVQELDQNMIEIKMNSRYSLKELKEFAELKNSFTKNNQISLSAVFWDRASERVLGDWQKGQSLKIELVLNPIRRIDLEYFDAYDTFQKYVGILRSEENPKKSPEEIEQLANLSREQIYANWVLERFGNFIDCVKVENVITVDYGMESVARKCSNKKLRTVEQPIAKFTGELTILDTTKINELLVRGIGRQKCFGRGMLKIVSNG